MHRGLLSFYRGKRILVTGGAGTIGSNLVRELVRLQPDLVIALDDLSSGHTWNLPSTPGLLFVRGRVQDEAVLKRVFAEGVRVVFHLAAHFANQRSIDYPEADLETNVLGTLRVLEYAALSGVERFLYTGSGCSAQPGPDATVSEDSVPEIPSSPYQISKYAGELYCRYFYTQRQVPIVVARPFNCYGPGEVPGQYRNVVTNFVYWAMRGRPLVITGDGSESRDFTFVGDVVRGLLLLGASDRAIGETVNLGSGRKTTIRHLADVVLRTTGSQSKTVYTKRRSWDTKPEVCADIRKARELVGYEPRTMLQEGIRLTVDWFRRNFDLIERHADFPVGVSSANRSVVS